MSHSSTLLPYWFTESEQKIYQVNRNTLIQPAGVAVGEEDDDEEEESRLGEAAALPPARASSNDHYLPADDDDIDENLFDEDGLDLVEEELDTLELADWRVDTLCRWCCQMPLLYCLRVHI